jgi:predicted DNA-binding transcriptional regulator AlpA
MMQQVFTTLTESDLTEIIHNAVIKAVGSNTQPTTKSNPIDRTELMKRLGVTEPTIIRLERKGLIPSFRIGSAVRYQWESVLESLEKNQLRKEAGRHA